MTSGRREKTVRDFVQELDGTGTLTEKLEAANRILHERISPIDNRGKKVELPDPLLAVDLQLNTEEYQWLIELLSEALEGAIKYPKALEKMLSSYPMVFIAALTGTALLDTSDSYWESFWRRMRIRNSDPLYNLLRRELNRELNRKKLITFSDADLIGKDYVGTIRLHAGIPTRDLGFLLEFIEETTAQYEFTDSVAFAEYAVKVLVDDQTPASLRALVTHLPGRAADIFARIQEVHEWYHGLEDKNEVDNFEGTHGLPEPTFAYLLKLLRDEVEAVVEDPSEAETVTYPAPHLQLDPNTLELHLFFPAIEQVKQRERSAPEWTILIDDAPTTLTPQEDWSTGGYEEHRFNLTKPFSRLSVVGPNGGTLTFLENLGGSHPMLFLRPNGQMLKEQRKLSSRTTLAIMPAAAVVRASTQNNHSFTYQDLGPVHGWKDWVVRELPLEHVKTFTVSSGVHRAQIEVKQARGAVWLEKGTMVPHLRGLDQLPVYRSSPQLLIPEGKSSWLLRYYQLLPDGQQIAMDTYEVEDHLRGVPFDVFDAMDDPWVGRFQVELYKNSRLRETRTFNLAEGLHLKLSFQKFDVYGSFQVPVQTEEGPALSQAFAEFSDENNAGLRTPIGTQVIRAGSTGQSFTLSSREDPETFFLEVKVEAPRLQYRLPLREEIAPWSAALQTFNFDDLAEGDDFQLRFPAKVEDVQLIVSEVLRHGRLGNKETITLSRKGNSQVWTTPIGRINAAMENEAEYAVVATWKALSIDEYLSQKMSTLERKAWFKLPQDKQSDPRNPAHVPLLRVSKKPLLAAAKITDDQLELTLGRESALPLEAWAWSVHRPLDPPVQIPLQGRTGTIPEQFSDGGPLIIEAREEAFLSFWEPESPSQQSIIVERPAMLEPHLDPFITHRWLFSPEADRELLPREIQLVWESRDKLHHVLGRKENRDIPSLQAFDDASSTYLLHNPRMSLNELSKSSLPQERHFEAFIRSGLVAESFSAWETAGDIHPVPWIGLIQEMNDLRILRSRLRSNTSLHTEKKESEDYIHTTGGTELWKTLTGVSRGIPVILKVLPGDVELRLIQDRGVEALSEHLEIEGRDSTFISTDTRSAAQFEWLEHRRDLLADHRLQELFEAATRWENLIDHLDDPELKRTALELANLPKGHRQSEKDNWLYVPYISFVFSFLARMTAHGLIRPVAELHSLRHGWATMARHVPAMTSFDLVVAEAAALHAAGSFTGS